MVQARVSSDNVAVALLLYVLMLLQLLRLDAERADYDTACHGSRRQTGLHQLEGASQKLHTLLTFQVNNVLFAWQDAHGCDR